MRTLPFLFAFLLAFLLTFLLTFLLAGASPAVAQDDRPMRWVKDPKLQKQIHRAIDRGVAYLFSIQQPNGSWSFLNQKDQPRPKGRGGKLPDIDRFGKRNKKTEPTPVLNHVTDGGLTAIALYALATSGVKRTDSGVRRALQWIDGYPEGFDHRNTSAVYACSLLVLAYIRLDAKHFKMKIHTLARRLAESQHPNGMWGYKVKRPGKKSAYAAVGRGSHTDNSNTQFAVLALWAAHSLSGWQAPPKLWNRVERHYRATQAKGGFWGYKPGGRRSATMTAAGLACFVYARAAIEGGELALERARGSKTAKAGLIAYQRWMERPEWDNYYMVYSIERVGTVLDLRDLSWYEQGARHLIKKQDRKSGKWAGRTMGSDPGSAYPTSLALLFLGRGTYPPIKGATTPPDRVDVISPSERVPLIGKTKTHSRAFEIYLSLDAEDRAEQSHLLGARGPEMIDRLIIVLETDGRTPARKEALDVLQRLLAKRFLFMVDAPEKDRKMMAGAIRSTWDGMRANVQWDNAQGRYVPK
jgi:hypothetical protein